MQNKREINRLAREAIYVEEIRKVAKKIKIGQKIKCEVLAGDAEESGIYPTKIKTVQVTNKYKKFLEVCDAVGLKHYVLYVDLVMKERKKNKRREGTRCKS